MATAHGSGIIYCSSRLMGQKQREFPSLRVVESKAKTKVVLERSKVVLERSKVVLERSKVVLERSKVVLERSSNYEFSSTQKVTDQWVVLARLMGSGCSPLFY
jgi:hypothetical protein